MHDLRLVGVHADGQHLLLADEAGDRFRLAIDQQLREAVRRDRAQALRDAGISDQEPMEFRPRDIQALIRSGLSLEEISERSGWPVAKIERYEPPVRAERDHVALLVQELPIARGAVDGPSNFGERITERLSQRGVDTADITWDSWRNESDWTVVASYPAGGRLRQATWRFDPAAQSVQPTDDEARWLGEDEAPHVKPVGGSVFDLEANGGLDETRRPARRRVPGSRPQEAPDSPGDGDRANEAHSGESSGPRRADAPQTDEGPVESDTNSAAETAKSDQNDPVDLVSVMRERSKGRRRGRRRSTRDEQQPAPVTPPVSESADQPGDADESTNESLDHDPVTGTRDLFATLDEGNDSGASSTDESDDDEVVVPSRPSNARKGRPSVPSWDDIMFGNNPRDED